jgi:hypothetical protein
VRMTLHGEESTLVHVSAPVHTMQGMEKSDTVQILVANGRVCWSVRDYHAHLRRGHTESLCEQRVW